MITTPLHPVTKDAINNAARAANHALLVSGPSGSGARAVAIMLAEQMLETDDFATYPYGMLLEPQEKEPYGVEVVRQIEHFLSRKVPRNSTINRVIIIDQADALTLDAQNILLKTLEEPPASTSLILVAHQPNGLLPTVRSRLTTVPVRKPGREQLQDHFQSRGHSDDQVKRFYGMTAGLPELMQAILEDDSHPMLAAAEQARKLLGMTAYERLLLVDELAKDPQLVNDTLEVLQQMAHVSLASASGQAAKRWRNVLEVSYRASESLQRNGQIKLVLTDVMISL